MWVQGHLNYDALCKHGRKNNYILKQSFLSHVTCLCAPWRYKAERDHPAANALVWCSMKMLCRHLYTMCILQELATAISVQVMSVRWWDWSNTVQNAYGTVSLHGAIVKITENRVIVIIIIKKGRQCKAEREWCTTYQSEDPSLTIPTYRQNEEKGEKSRRL